MSALFVPVVMILTGFVIPFHGETGTSWTHMHGAIGWWPIRIVLFAVIFFSFFHCAHRIKHVVPTLGIKPSASLLAVVCYGGAFVGTVAAAVALVRL